jgi:hypothetical protein
MDEGMKDWIERISAGCLLLLILPFAIVLAPIWVPLNWWIERQYLRDMARPRGCLTYRMTPEQLAYFEAMIEREREEEARTLVNKGTA